MHYLMTLEGTNSQQLLLVYNLEIFKIPFPDTLLARYYIDPQITIITSPFHADIHLISGLAESVLSPQPGLRTKITIT